MLLQKIAMVRGGGPSEPAAAPAFPLDPDGPIIKNLNQGTSSNEHATSISPTQAPGTTQVQ